MKIRRFKKGDRVILVKGGQIGWEVDMWWKCAKMKLGKTYTLQAITRGGLSIRIRNFWHHPNHFELSSSLEGNPLQAIINQEVLKLRGDYA